MNPTHDNVYNGIETVCARINILRRYRDIQKKMFALNFLPDSDNFIFFRTSKKI